MIWPALPWWVPFGSVPEISANDLQTALGGEQPPQVVDVRTDAEFRRGHIRGAMSAPVTALGERLPALRLEPGRLVVAICLSAHRSIPAVRLLRSRGFEAVQLSGGMLAWRAAGLPEEAG